MNAPRSPDPLVIGPSTAKLLGTMGIGVLGMIVGASLLILSLWGMVALRSWGWMIVAVVAALGIGNLVLALARQRPRLELDAEGFSVLPVIGGHSRRWSDIDGDFVVIKCGFTQAVAYRLTPAYKTSLGFKPTTLFEGNDAAIMGAYAMSIPDLAKLLNDYKAQALGSKPE